MTITIPEKSILTCLSRINKWVVFLLVMCYFMSGCISNVLQSSDWYNRNWKYRRSITVDNATNSNTLNNYQIRVDLTSSNFNFSNAQSSGQDIRFIDSDGTTLLNYWIESYDSISRTSTLWVNIPVIPASSLKTIYLIYGNYSESTGSNGTKTFNFFDDFKAGKTIWSRKGTVLKATTAQDDNNVYEPTVIFETVPQILSNQKNVFKMWYSSGWNHPNLNYAESADGINWTKYSNNPIISSHHLSYMVKKDTTYYLYSANTPTQIDLYTSSDGVNFMLDTQAVIVKGLPGSWDGAVIANLVVWVEGVNEWKMLYEAIGSSTWQIGLATSSDGRTWTKYSNNPVISETGSRGGPAIYKNGYDYWLWIHGSSTSVLPTDIYRYHSTDLVKWTPSPFGIVFNRQTIDEGAGSGLGQVADPVYLQHNGNIYMWYSASSDGNKQEAGQHIKLAIAGNMTFKDLVTSNEEYTVDMRPSDTWTVRGSMVISSNELDMPANTDSDDTPTFESRYANDSYIYEFRAKMSGGSSTRLEPVIAYLDDNNFVRYCAENANITYFQARVDGTWKDEINIGANNAVDGDYHRWKVVRTPNDVTLFIDDKQIGTAQSLPVKFKISTKIGLAGYNVAGKWDDVRLRKYASPEPNISVGSELSR